MKSNPVAWFEIYVQDVDRAKRFFESVFQVTLQKPNAPFPEVELWAFPAGKLNGLRCQSENTAHLSGLRY